MDKKTKPGQKSWAHIPYFDKKCKVCGVMFKSPSPRKNTCSQKCFDVNKREWKRSHNLKKHYGLTVEEYDKKLADQDHRCAICESTKTLDYGKRLSVDHNHKTGKIRDLLCTRCNTVVGIMESNPELFERAKEYLRKHA